MNPKALPYALLLSGLVLPGTLRSEETAQAIAERSSVAYLEAWQAGDAEAVSALYTEDAEYTSDDGTLLTGRAAIREQTEAAFAEYGGAELTVEVESARFLTPDVIAENGYASVSLDGESTSTMYNATHVKKDGEWLIAEVHESSLPAPEADLSSEALTRLDWLTGNWKVDDGSENPATVEVKYVLDGRFLLRTTVIPDEEDPGEPFTAVELIGYDPVTDRLRSWVFDNEGGHGEGNWSSEGPDWMLSIRATGPDGGVSSSDHAIEIVDENTVLLDTTNRFLDGEALPNREALKLIRMRETSTAFEQ